ncbi:mitochondrial inner membrane protein Mitofilin [Xylogone sp. PMI_703]|nr:mitochondrial inner membrane protein Mitofilin [Xylogone sp. PMI_703]
MLRATLQSSRAFSYRPIAANVGRQWRGQTGLVQFGALRGFADEKKLDTTSPTPATPSSSSTIPPETIPPPASAAPKPPPPPAPKPKKHRLRRLLVTLILLTGLGFGGGVYYSRINDNFHDFFTEYVPYGEEAVLYFEEQEFRKRFPSALGRKSRDTGERVKIPSQSGVSWRVADDSERHTTSVKKDQPKPASEQSRPGSAPAEISPAPDTKSKQMPSPDKPSHPVPHTSQETASLKKGEEPKEEPKKTSPASFKAPEVDEPSRFPDEVTRIDPINIKDANEPLVQDLVKIINDIITVVNADNANSRFSATIGKAKDELSKVGGKINELKEAAKKDADAKIKSSHEDFDRAAKELIRRLENEMREQEAKWRDEYEAERQKIQEAYDHKLKAEIERANELNEKRLQNQLLEQAVELKQKFIEEVRNRVEEERNGRLGKLSELSNSVGELEKLTTDWNSVLDTNLQTQHLHVAVEAVRAIVEGSSGARPFTKELVALKEIAGDDPVVNAAIASINPTAYQHGISSPAQLIDRFRKVATEVRKASLLPEEAGVASHASSYLLSKIMFKKKGLAAGDDVESILTRTETYLEEGDLDGAAREMNGLQGWAKMLSKDWLNEVRRVLEVQQALDVISTEARLQSLRLH